MTTSSTSEHRVDEPAGFDDLNQQIKDQRAALAKLDSLSDDVDELYNDAAKMDEPSRETVAQEMQQLQHEVVSLASIADLETAKERIAEVIAAPYRQAVKRARETVCEVVGIEGNLDAETVDGLNEALTRSESDELREMETSFNRIQDRLRTLPKAAQTAVGQLLLDNTDLYLTSPETKLEPVVDTVEAQSNALETVDQALDGLAWGPDEPLAATSDYYGVSVDAVDADTVVHYVNTVDDRLADTDGLDLTTVAQAHLAQVLPVEDPADLVGQFKELSRYTTKSARYESTFVHASALVDTVGDPSAHEASDVAGYTDEVNSFIEDPSGDKPARRLAEKLRLLAEEYDHWTDTYTSLLTRDAVAIQAVDSYTELPDFSSPSEVIDLTADGVTPEMVEEQPVEAVAAHQAYEDWVDTLRGEASPNGGADIDLLLALVRGDTVSAADVGPAEFATLEELLGDELTLRLTDGPEEA